MPQCCRCNGNGCCKGCVCVRCGKACINCTPSHAGRCENLESVARAETEDRGPADDANAPVIVNGQLESHGQQASLMKNTPLLDNQTSGMESGMPLLDNQTPGMESATSHQQPNTGRYEDPWPLPTCSQPDFQWGSHDGKAFCDMIDESYNDIIHWKRNIFLLPSGATRKSFIQEITRLHATCL